MKNKIVSLFLLMIGLYSCNHESNTNVKQSKTDNLVDCVDDRFIELIGDAESSMKEILGINEINLYYKPLTEEERFETENVLSELLIIISKESNEKMINKKDFKVSEVGCCNQLSSNKVVSYYTDIIWYSQDYKYQYVRFYEFGGFGRYDYLIRVTEDQRKVLVFG
jgi:hypothetical protein